MTKYTFNQKIFDSIIILLLILSTGGLLFVYNRNFVSITFFILLAVGVFFSRYKYSKALVRSVLLSVFLVVFLGLFNYYFAIVEQTENKYLFHFLTLLISSFTVLHFLNNRTKEILLDRLYVVLKLVSFHAAINFIIYFFIQNNLTVITSTYHECETFANLFFYTPSKAGGIGNIFGIEFCRNQGLFWEPGILQIYLNILFFLEAFIYKKTRWLLFFISIIILTTYSTTGIALLLLQFFFYIKDLFKKNKLLAPIFLLVIIPVYLIFNVNVDAKIKGERESSFQKRMFDFTQPLFIAIEHPITGVGLDLFQFQNFRKEFYFSSPIVLGINSFLGIEGKIEVTDKGSSNSVMFLLAGTGFPTFIILMYMLFNQQIVQKKRWLWILIIMISVMSEPLLLRPFFFMFIVSGLTGFFYKITSHRDYLL